MPRKYSLKLRKDFQRLFRSGARVRSRYFSVVCAPSDSVKFAFVVDSKTIKKASQRVYAKRVMREIVRRWFLPCLSCSFHFAIRPTCNISQLVKTEGFDQIKADLLAILDSAVHNARVEADIQSFSR